MRARARPRNLALLALRALLALTLLAFALRLALRVDHDEDVDALRFRLGVERFDVSALRPHAPFYPVFIAAAKLVAALGAPSRLALAWVSAGAGAALIALTALLALELFGPVAAALAGALALASPFSWLLAEKLTSDMAGAAGVALALYLLARARRPGAAAAASAWRTGALIVLGLGLGVRLSFFPFALVAVACVARAEGGSAAAYTSRARDLATGVVIWLVPLTLIAGPRPLVAMSRLQALGHFTRWGGTALTVTSPAARLHGLVWGLWANLLGGAWPDASRARLLVAPLLVLLLAVAAWRALPCIAARAPELTWGSLAYLAWALLGQNTAYKPRHFLPLAPLAIVAIAGAAAALDARAPLRRPGSAAALLLAASWFIDGASLAAAHRDLSPAAAIVRAVAETPASDARPIVTRELLGMLAEGAPGRRLVFAPNTEALIDAVVASGPAGARVTSEALSPEARAALAARGLEATVELSLARSRYIDALWSDLALVAVRPAHAP